MNKIISFIKKISSYKYFDLLLLFSFFLISIILRIYLIDRNLFFGPEQGRDVLVMKEIAVNHKLVLIGPKTAIDGVFHGPLYYYIGVIPFLIGKGNPLFISTFFIIINSLSVIFIYLLGKELFDKRVGIIASLMFTSSFGLIVMSRWLSHPPLIIPISCLFFLFLAKFLKGKNIYLILTAFFFGFSSQVEFSNVFIFGSIIAFVIPFFRKRFLRQKKSILFLSLIILIVTSFGNFILFDLRHTFLITGNIFKLLSKNSGYFDTFFNSFINSTSNFINIFSDSITPQQPIVAFIILVLGTFLLFKKRITNKIGVYLLLIWLVSPLIVFVVLKYNPLYHYFTSILIGGIILTSVLIDTILSSKKLFGIIFIIILILFNLYSWIRYLPTNQNVFFQATQPELRYSDQVMVIDEIYKRAAGKEFYFQSYTIPYWLQEEWEYLFWYFGENKYNYIPINERAKTLFVIIQNDPSNMQFQNDWLKNTVSKWGKKTDEFKFGALKVEEINVK